MKLIVCVDDNLGMMFNNRRQSRDKKVVDKINEMIGNKTLYISNYSQILFPNAEIFTTLGNKNDYYFIENPDLIILDYVDEVVLFRWNRAYPSDKKFNLNLNCFDMIFMEEFEGSSHEKITLEHYVKKIKQKGRF